MARHLDEAPEWMEKWAGYVQDALGITEDVVFGARPKPGGERRNDGFTLSEVRYNRATVIMKEGLEDRYQTYQDVLHEYLHIALGPAANSVGYLLRMLPDKAQRELGLDLWLDGVESSIERLARALGPRLLEDYRAELAEEERLRKGSAKRGKGTKDGPGGRTSGQAGS